MGMWGASASETVRRKYAEAEQERMQVDQENFYAFLAAKERLRAKEEAARPAAADSGIVEAEWNDVPAALPPPDTDQLTDTGV